MKRVIVTADDFGLSIPVNEAVETAHRAGILTGTSLMVTAPAAADAVERARRLPSLGVGLHLVLMDGRPALAPQEIPDLVGPDGRFRIEPARTGIQIFFLERVQRQVEAEMRAQFEWYKATGLPLDHVDGHHHFHQHPTIVGLLIKMAREYGVKAVRVPQEPLLSSWRAQRTQLLQRLLAWLFAVPRLTGMQRRLRAAGIACNDHLFGLHESGRMTPDRVQRFIDELPDGVSEIYCHPATRRWHGTDALPPHYLCVEEFRALLQATIDPATMQRIRFGDLTTG